MKELLKIYFKQFLWIITLYTFFYLTSHYPLDPFDLLFLLKKFGIYLYNKFIIIYISTPFPEMDIPKLEKEAFPKNLQKIENGLKPFFEKVYHIVSLFDQEYQIKLKEQIAHNKEYCESLDIKIAQNLEELEKVQKNKKALELLTQQALEQEKKVNLMKEYLSHKKKLILKLQKYSLSRSFFEFIQKIMNNHSK